MAENRLTATANYDANYVCKPDDLIMVSTADGRDVGIKFSALSGALRRSGLPRIVTPPLHNSSIYFDDFYVTSTGMDAGKTGLIASAPAGSSVLQQSQYGGPAWAAVTVVGSEVAVNLSNDNDHGYTGSLRIVGIASDGACAIANSNVAAGNYNWIFPVMKKYPSIGAWGMNTLADGGQNWTLGWYNNAAACLDLVTDPDTTFSGKYGILIHQHGAAYNGAATRDVYARVYDGAAGLQTLLLRAVADYPGANMPQKFEIAHDGYGTLSFYFNETLKGTVTVANMLTSTAGGAAVGVTGTGMVPCMGLMELGGGGTLRKMWVDFYYQEHQVPYAR